MLGTFAGTAEERKKIPASPSHQIDNPNIGTIPDLMAGRWPGRTNDRQITFLNNSGTQGLQFAAVGGRAYELAKARGFGHPLPRTTERPVRMRGDECSGFPVGAVPQSHGRKPVVRGLPLEWFLQDIRD